MISESVERALEVVRRFTEAGLHSFMECCISAKVSKISKNPVLSLTAQGRGMFIMDCCSCEECKKLERYENEKKDQYFLYRKNFSHWIWHENGYLLLMPFDRVEGDPVNHMSITMSKWNWKDDGRIAKLTWIEEYKWNLSLFINGEKKEEDIVIIPNDINETLDVNMFMNLCCHWMRIYPAA